MGKKRRIDLTSGESVDRLTASGFDSITIRESCCGNSIFDGAQAIGRREVACPDCGAVYSLTISRA